MEIESKKGRGKKREEKHEKGRFKSARFVAEKWPPLKKKREKNLGTRGVNRCKPWERKRIAASLKVRVLAAISLFVVVGNNKV